MSDVLISNEHANEIGRLMAEIERLTAINAKIVETAQEYADENVRLTAALRDIEMETREGGQWTGAEINEVARAALSDQQEEPHTSADFAEATVQLWNAKAREQS